MSSLNGTESVKFLKTVPCSWQGKVHLALRNLTTGQYNNTAYIVSGFVM